MFTIIRREGHMKDFCNTLQVQPLYQKRILKNNVRLYIRVPFFVQTYYILFILFVICNVIEYPQIIKIVTYWMLRDSTLDSTLVP